MLAVWPREVWALIWAFFGLFVGSFLNVCIYRFPLENENVAKPARSRCPSCKTTLTWRENLPLVSWLALRGRCRTCGWRIPWRYPLVEALTGGLFFLVGWLTLPGQLELALIYSCVLSGLVVATFVDFDRFEIPDEVSIGGMVAAPIVSFLVPELHANTLLARLMAGDGHAVGRTDALLASLAGIVVGAGILWLIGWIGSKVYGRDAMGFGDVKLLGAAGGFVGPGGALVVLVLASLVASVVGLLNMLRFLVLLRVRARARGRSGGFRRSLSIARIAGRYLPFGPYLALGIGIVLLAWNHVRALIP